MGAPFPFVGTSAAGIRGKMSRWREKNTIRDCRIATFREYTDTAAVQAAHC